MRRLCMLSICIIFISTSGYAEIEIKPEPRSESVFLHIYRPTRIVGFGWNFKLKAKGKKLTKIKNGEYLTLKLESGMTEFNMGNSFMEMNLESAKHYYLRASLTRNMLLGKPEIVEVTERQAKKEIANL